MLCNEHHHDFVTTRRRIVFLLYVYRTFGSEKSDTGFRATYAKKSRTDRLHALVDISEVGRIYCLILAASSHLVRTRKVKTVLGNNLNYQAQTLG